jgi:hypothetical protein
MLEWHRQLIALRKSHVVPGYEPKVSFDGSTGTLEFGDGPLLVKCDFDRSVVEIEVDGEVALA